MKIFLSPLFIVCSTLFLLHQLLQLVLNVRIVYADAYLDNLVAMPIILTILCAERRYLFKKGDAYHLSIQEVFLATLYIIAISEILFPQISSRFTFDWMDMLYYLIGAGSYVIIGC